MNPSSNGWIAKYGHLIAQLGQVYEGYDDMYKQLRVKGFVYGFNTDLPFKINKSLVYSLDEIAKINLINAHYHTYRYYRPTTSYNDFIKDLLSFYQSLEISKKYCWKKLTSYLHKRSSLEKLIHNRVRIDANPFTRNFQKTITNALLFVDVLTFKSYLERDIAIKPYATNLEYVIMNISFEAGQQLTKSGNEQLGKKYSSKFAESYFFSRTKKSVVNKHYRKQLNEDFTQLERQYFLDLACAICYSDFNLSESDLDFLSNLAVIMHLDPTQLDSSIQAIKNFYENHKKIKKHQKGNGPLYNFYDNSSELVVRVINRNKTRIIQEVRQSRDLMYLLVQARKRPLTLAEQKKVQTQLLDILKTVPSLAIFMLPGGALLLPMFAKLLPSMLPSSFDENKI